MKKYLIVSIAVILCGVGWIFVSSRFSLYVRLGGERSLEAGPFWVEGKEIYHEIHGKKETFQIRGVNIESFIPGHFVTDYGVSKKQYQEWFGLIQELGANTVRIPTIYNSGFYDALYEYNMQREEEGQEPLYLLQALWVTDYAQDSKEDAYSEGFYGQLQRDMKNAVDVIYGNILLPFGKTRGSGWYRRDISKWVIGITLGTTWRGDTSAYTNQMREKPLYDGKWFRASKKASQFENMMALLLNTLTEYESVKYGYQHLVSIASEPVTDPFDYEDLIEVQLEKYDKIDGEHILPKETLLSGFFISYKLYDVCPDILDYLTQEEQGRLAHILADITPKGSYGGYLELLQGYYSVPVVVGECGYSSARGLTKSIEEEFSGVHTSSHGLTEQEQGEALVGLYEACKRAGLSGMVISDWQDNWSKTDWNIYPMTNKEREPYWHNVQSEAQGCGLLAFEPGEERLVVVDGEPSEWTGEEPLISNEWGSLYVRQDEAYLYLLLEWAPAWKEMPKRIYIPMDITPNSGSKSGEDFGVLFDREADFLLCLEGKDQGQLLVQDYYDPWRAAWNQRIEHADAYTIDVPQKDSKKFVPIRMVLDNDPVYSADWNLRNAERADTGRLRFGIADETDPEFDSQADFYTLGNCTEVRIPWALLNFQDPSRGVIHDDYYEHYGIEGQRVEEIYLGLGTSQKEEISMEPLTLKNWGRKVAYHQRLKQSYYILKNCWIQEP